VFAGCFQLITGDLMSRLTPSMLTVGILVAFAGVCGAQDTTAQESPAVEVAGESDKAVLDLSKLKWRWMSERKVDSLEALFHEEAVFVHMGGTMSREQELEVIRSGRIHYKDV